MRAKKKGLIVLASIAVAVLGYAASYLCFVHPMPVHANGSGGGDSVQPVFRTANPRILSLFRPAVGLDQQFFPGRWDPKRFQLPPTNLAGLGKMASFRARVESVGRTMPHSTGISGLHLGLRLESGHLLAIDEPNATEQMFVIAGSLQDFQLHDFPQSWFHAKIAR